MINFVLFSVWICIHLHIQTILHVDFCFQTKFTLLQRYWSIVLNTNLDLGTGSLLEAVVSAFRSSDCILN